MIKYCNIIWLWCWVVWNKKIKNFQTFKDWASCYTRAFKVQFAAVLPYDMTLVVWIQFYWEWRSKSTKFIGVDSPRLSAHRAAHEGVTWRGPNLLNLNSLFLHLSLLMLTERQVDSPLAWRHSRKTLFWRQRRMWACPHCRLHFEAFVAQGIWRGAPEAWLGVYRWMVSLWTLFWSDHQNLLTCPSEAVFCPGRMVLGSHRLPIPHLPLKRNLAFAWCRLPSRPRSPRVFPDGLTVWASAPVSGEVLLEPVEYSSQASSAAGERGSPRRQRWSWLPGHSLCSGSCRD